LPAGSCASTTGPALSPLSGSRRKTGRCSRCRNSSAAATATRYACINTVLPLPAYIFNQRVDAFSVGFEVSRDALVGVDSEGRLECPVLKPICVVHVQP